VQNKQYKNRSNIGIASSHDLLLFWDGGSLARPEMAAISGNALLSRFLDNSVYKLGKQIAFSEVIHKIWNHEDVICCTVYLTLQGSATLLTATS